MNTLSNDKAFNSLKQFDAAFPDEAACVEYFAKARWNGKPVCPYCGSEKVYTLKGATKRFKCANNGKKGEGKCARLFSVRVGSIFEDSNLPLQTWFKAIYLCSTSSKGLSSVQLAKWCGVTQKTGWFVLSRIRVMLKDTAPVMLTGEVEADETYVGGLEKNKHYSKRTRTIHGRTINTKATVFGLKERGGRVVIQAVLNSRKASIQPIMRKHVAIGSTLYTDEFTSYEGLSKDYDHKVVKHKSGQYVLPNGASTNGVENVWSVFQRGLIGVYHFVSPKHLQLYCDEYAYRHNLKKASLQEKFEVAVKQSAGRRLTYKGLIAKKS